MSACWKEPIPGYVDNLNGLTGAFVAFSRGIMKVSLCNADLKLDCVPVDVAAKLILISCINSTLIGYVLLIFWTINKKSWINNKKSTCRRTAEVIFFDRVFFYQSVPSNFRKHRIYNVSVEEKYRLSLKTMTEVSVKYPSSIPLGYALSSPEVIITQNKFIYWVLVYILHYLPALILDFLLVIFRQKPL